MYYKIIQEFDQISTKNFRKIERDNAVLNREFESRPSKSHVFLMQD